MTMRQSGLFGRFPARCRRNAPNCPFKPANGIDQQRPDHSALAIVHRCNHAIKRGTAHRELRRIGAQALRHDAAEHLRRIAFVADGRRCRRRRATTRSNARRPSRSLRRLRPATRPIAPLLPGRAPIATAAPGAAARDRSDCRCSTGRRQRAGRHRAQYRPDRLRRQRSNGRKMTPLRARIAARPLTPLLRLSRITSVSS